MKQGEFLEELSSLDPVYLNSLVNMDSNDDEDQAEREE